MQIRVIERPVEGHPVLLLPDGLLLRWPRDRPMPKVGDPFDGSTLTCTSDDQRNTIKTLVAGTALERCDAALALPMSVVQTLYSYSMATNMRRASRRLYPALREQIPRLQRSGRRVSTRQLIEVASCRTEAEQLARWHEYFGDERASARPDQA